MPKINSPLLILFWNALIVFAVFMVLDVIFHGWIWPGPDPYQNDLFEKICYSLGLALAYAHIYNKASRAWKPKSSAAFIMRKVVAADDYNADAKGYKVFNGIVFSLLTTIIIILAIGLLKIVFNDILINLLQAFRGDLLSVDSSDATVLTAEILVSGVILETHGKTEDDGNPI